MIRITSPAAPTAPVVEPIGISAKEAAKALSISERTLWQFTKDGVIPAVKVGSRVIYSVDALREFVNGTRK